MHSKITHAAALALFLATSPARADAPRADGGALFTMTDDAAGNAVLAFARGQDGTLTATGVYPTDGAGSGGGEPVLGSQGAVTLSSDGRFLLVVNAGSDDISSFRIDGARLTLVGRAPSGGTFPVSVAEHGGLVYALNAGGDGDISGLLLDEHGALTPLADSTRPLGSTAAGAAQVAFDRSGKVLAVTEKAAQEIVLYAVDRQGRASAPTPAPSSGAVPFGFAFTIGDVLVVSEAGGGVSGTSAVSSYAVDGVSAEVVSSSVPNFQRAACWLVITRNGRHAYVANAGSGDISAYRIDRQGELTLPPGAEIAATLPGGKPLDLALAGGDAFLYAVDASGHSIAGFSVGDDGALTPFASGVSGLPASAVGLAAK
ncbi:lactonase family protein [Anaeromyxobacter sp. Red801]|uniref:lactonase family protein n=1 Tax=Anaeromyxobacter sp. Red801 TaxID=3411632 RepID=UPI003B9FE8EA